MKIENSTALVTGAGRRLGRAFALALGAAGMRVAVHYNNSRVDAQATLDQLRALGREAVGLECDLTDPVAAAKLITRAEAALGPVQVLVNSASVFIPGRVEDTAPDRLRVDFALHAEAAYALAREMALRLPTNVEGRIVNLLDWRASRLDPDYVSYSVAKSALLALTQLLARSLAPRITVNGIAPGIILPPETTVTTIATPRKQTSAEVPARRAGTPQDVVNALLYLVRDADYVTGAVIPVDGGRHLL
ncbi:MAG: SDR family oxidoreductase [Planctomycetota bacterium]